MKYIIAKRRDGGVTRRIPIIFPNYLAHAEVAKALESIIGKQIDSAGEFSSLDLSDIKPHGHSDSLNKDSKRNDGQIIANQDYWHGL